jgi:hypothetical protein
MCEVLHYFVMKPKLAATTDAKSRRKRALAIIARTKRSAVPAGIDLVDFREPSAVERANGKLLESRARALLSEAKGADRIRKLAVSH